MRKKNIKRPIFKKLCTWFVEVNISQDSTKDCQFRRFPWYHVVVVCVFLPSFFVTVSWNHNPTWKSWSQRKWLIQTPFSYLDTIVYCLLLLDHDADIPFRPWQPKSPDSSLVFLGFILPGWFRMIKQLYLTECLKNIYIYKSVQLISWYSNHW